MGDGPMHYEIDPAAEPEPMLEHLAPDADCTDLRVYYFWTRYFQKSQEAVKRYAPGATWVRTGELGSQPQDYARKVRALWGKTSMLFVEQDIVIRAGLVRSMRECGYDWCVARYPVGSNGALLRFGLGCTKFSRRLQEALDYERVFLHNTTPGNLGCPCGIECEVCPCYKHQDTILRHEFTRLGMMEPHLHEPPLKHLHDYRGHPALLDDRGGVYRWEAPEGKMLNPGWK